MCVITNHKNSCWQIKYIYIKKINIDIYNKLWELCFLQCILFDLLDSSLRINKLKQNISSI